MFLFDCSLCILISLLSFHSIDWLTIIIGGLVGVLFSCIYSLVLSLYKTKRKEQISRYKISEESYKTIDRDGIDVHVFFNGSEYRSGLTILRFALINNSDSSLSYEKNFYEPIFIKSEEYVILDAIVINPMPTRSEVSINEDGIVSLQWGLWKKGESIEIQLIGHLLSKDDPGLTSELSMYDSLRFSVRSESIESITSNRYSLTSIILTIFLTSLFCFCLQYLFVAKDSNSRLYTFEYSGKSITGILEYNNDNNSFIISSPDSLSDSSRLLDFERHPQITVSNSINLGSLIFIICVSIFLIFSGIVVVTSYIDRRKDRRKMFSAGHYND